MIFNLILILGVLLPGSIALGIDNEGKKTEDYGEYSSKITRDEYSGIMNSLETIATERLKGKLGIDRIGGKEKFMLGGKIEDKSNEDVSGKLPAHLEDFTAHDLEGKLEKDRIGRKGNFMLGGKIEGKTNEDISGKLPTNLEDFAALYLEGKLGKDRIGRKGNFMLGGKIEGKTNEDVSGKLPTNLEDFAALYLEGKWSFHHTNPEKEFSNDIEPPKLNPTDNTKWIRNNRDFHPIKPWHMRSGASPSAQKFHANIDLCLKFFFSVQELPRYFAGVSDALLNATRSGLPLAQKVMTCSKGSFMESMTCVRDMELEIRDYYLTLAPVFKPPIIAFHSQLVKVKEELEGCLVIKSPNQETIL